uniref:Uncharacterized protein n=1 Tax=Lepeophtheirus salmonis TaxID=72036 RepID=A0A0K2U604_LEPSM
MCGDCTPSTVLVFAQPFLIAQTQNKHQIVALSQFFHMMPSTQFVRPSELRLDGHKDNLIFES